jgi:hypothetical protein
VDKLSLTRFSKNYGNVAKQCITFLSPLRVTFLNIGSKSDPIELFPFIVLVIAGEKRFHVPNFNLKIVRIQSGGGSWMLLDALLHCPEGSAGPCLKNIMWIHTLGRTNC